MGNINKFELSKGAQREVTKIMNQLLEFCQINKVPMFCTVAVKSTEEETEYVNTVYGSKSHVIHLADDQIRRHMLIANGFEAVPARENITLDMEEVYNLGEDI